MSARNLLMATSKGVTNTVTAEQVQVYGLVSPYTAPQKHVIAYRFRNVSDDTEVTTLEATADVGYVFTLTVNGETYSRTHVAGNTLTTILNALVTLFNAGTKKDVFATAVRSTNKLFITSVPYGLPMVISGSTTKPGIYLEIKPQDILTPSIGGNAFDFDFGELDYDAGDLITITVGSTQTIYTVPTSMSPTTLVSNLASLTNAEGVFYNRFANNKLTVLANDHLTDVPVTCTVTNA